MRSARLNSEPRDERRTDVTRLSWGTPGERFFEAGVDRGVLYVDAAGVPWNGLVSVSESPVGGEPQPFYVDGVKYQNYHTSEEFEATVEAYTYPDEFADCDGTALVANGLFATGQRRKPFGLSYRTNVGNDIDGADHGYKIHLVYGATAAPSGKTNSTMSETVAPFNFSWKLTTKPPALRGRRRTAHFVIDSRTTPAEVLGHIEAILYGTEDTEPRLPVVPELVYIFEAATATLFDAGTFIEPFYNTFDAGNFAEVATSTVDGGAF